MIDYLNELDKRGLEPNTTLSAGQAFISCPFHSENTPSCSVSLKHGAFFCHGCKEGGSFIKLVAQLDSIPLSRARAKLWDDDDTELSLVRWKKKLNETDSLEKPVYYSWRSFKEKFKSVQSCPRALAYLHSRRIKTETAIRFGLRFGTTGKYKDRIILPVVSPSGKLISYAARTIHEGVQPKTRKASTKLKRTTLFGITNLITKRRYKFIILVEGEFDALFLMQRGYPALSCMGTSELTAEQISLLVSLTEGVILCYDDDAAGHKAEEINKEKLKEYLNVEIVRLSDGKDPDELSSKELKTAFGSFIY